MPLDKKNILTCIIQKLQADLTIAEQAVSIARDTATHADCMGSSRYDTMGLEASYLAQGQGTRLLEIERSLKYFKNITLSPATACIALNSLLQLVDHQGVQHVFWLATEAGGLNIQYQSVNITIITPKAPLGRTLIGLHCGNDFEINIAGKTHAYEIITVQ